MPKPQLTDEQAIELQEYCLEHPDFFISEILGVKAWKMQVDIVNAVFKYRNVAVKTCNSVGKSFIAARIVVAYLTLHPNSIVVTTAPTWRQVTDVLWREIATAVKMSKYKLTDAEVNQAGLNLDTQWYAVGVSTSHPDNMMGYHADDLLVVVDEAGGVDDLIFQGVKAITTNVNNKTLLIGNPTTAGGTFWNAFEPGSMYKQFSVSAFDTPNLLANGMTNLDELLAVFTPPEGIDKLEHFRETMQKLQMPYPELMSPGTVYERYLEWGIDSPAWQSLVMGEFPSQSDQSLIPTSLVSMAMNMYGIDDETGKSYAELSGWKIPDGPAEYGQDMARFGNDSNVLTPRRGGWVDKQVVWGKVDLMESADRILNIINPMDNDTRVNIDDTGNGGGTTDRMRQKSRESMEGGNPAHRYTLMAYNFSAAPNNPEKFHDITSEMYWNLRTQFLDKQIALHYDKDLFDQLVGRRWMITPAKKIKVESKEEYRKRTKGKSPDKSDSLALAYASRIRTNATQDAKKLQERKPLTHQFRPTTAGLGGY